MKPVKPTKGKTGRGAVQESPPERFVRYLMIAAFTLLMIALASGGLLILIAE